MEGTRARARPSRRRLTVIYLGIGFAPEQRERIFEEFVQLDSGPSRAHDGTGLGLAVSRGFVRLIGGDITVSSELGRGSTFTVTVRAAATESRPGPGQRGIEVAVR